MDIQESCVQEITPIELLFHEQFAQFKQKIQKVAKCLPKTLRVPDGLSASSSRGFFLDALTCHKRFLYKFILSDSVLLFQSLNYIKYMRTVEHIWQHPVSVTSRTFKHPSLSGAHLRTYGLLTINRKKLYIFVMQPRSSFTKRVQDIFSDTQCNGHSARKARGIIMTIQLYHSKI